MDEKYKLIYREVYNFHERHKEASTDKEWHAAIEEMKQINQKHRSTFAASLVAAVMTEIEKQNKIGDDINGK